MSTYRPAFHFTPLTGWINDPNGLVFEDGVYHLFAQHNPNEPIWGPMHWLHATSRDLLTWHHEGIAIVPDETLGMIFSGSAIIDKGNTSGLGQDADPMIAVFTHHGSCEQQSIAYSQDRVHFTKYAGNPVIPGGNTKDFRDPKVFHNPILNCWSLVLAAGDHVAFYASADLLDWRLTGTFGPEVNPQGHIFECPDLFPLIDPDGTTKWVLTASMIVPPLTGGSRTFAYIGDFDGNTFTMTERTFHLMDEGFDNYAAVTFNGVDDRIQIGWGTSWNYANQLPTGEYRGLMTCARKLSLTNTGDELRISAAPILPEMNDTPIKPIDHGCEAELTQRAFRLSVDTDEPFLCEVSNDAGEVFRFGLDNGNRFFTDRTDAGQDDFSPIFGSAFFGITKTERTRFGHTTMDLVFDNCLFELFADDGVYVNSTLAFPTHPYTCVRLLGKGMLRVAQ